MKFGKIFLILFSIFAFVLVACTDDYDTYSGDEAYVDDFYGFEITPPKGWMKSEFDEGANLVSFVNVKGDIDQEGEPFYANLAVLQEDSQGLSFSEYMEISKENTKEAIEGIEYISEEDLEVDGYPAEIVTSQFEQGGVSVVVSQLMTLRDGVVYIVTGASLASAWDENEEAIRGGLLSFSLN